MALGTPGYSEHIEFNIFMKKLAYIAPFAALVLPMVAFAQNTVQPSYITSVINLIGTVLNALIPILIAAALVAFFWGLVKYVWGGGENRDAGWNIMIAGLIALFVMVSVWGIIRVAQNTLGVAGGNGSITAPAVPRQGN